MTDGYRYPKTVPIDQHAFRADAANPGVHYGLPPEVAFCSGCVVSNQRPNSTVEYRHTSASAKKVIRFNADGRCDACHAADLKKKIDWRERDRMLRDVCDRHRRDDGHYDCIVPGSGGKDSFFAAHKLKYEYGMHPLTVTWSPHLYTEWGWHNFQSWIHAGFDNVRVTPNGKVHRLITRLAVENLFHPFQPFIIGQKALAPKLSALYGVPLVFYGENEAEYGNPVQDNEITQRSWVYFTSGDESDIHLGGVPVAELKAKFGIDANDLRPYMPADPDRLREVGTEVHYLGYYLKWHPQGAYYYTMEHGGFRPSPERTPGTYSKYNSIDDKIDDFHYFTTYIKFGIGRATYDAAQEVRSGDITRDEAVALVRRYDGEFPERFVEEIFQYLSIPEKEYGAVAGRFEQPIMDRAYFDNLCDRFRSPHLWKFENGAWSLRRAVYDTEG